jgi:hypothetical protein
MLAGSQDAWSLGGLVRIIALVSATGVVGTLPDCASAATCSPPVLSVTELSKTEDQQRQLRNYFDIILALPLEPLALVCGRECNWNPKATTGRAQLTKVVDSLFENGLISRGKIRYIGRNNFDRSIQAFTGICGTDLPPGSAVIVFNEFDEIFHNYPTDDLLIDFLCVIAHELCHYTEAQDFLPDFNCMSCQQHNQKLIRDKVMPGLEKVVRSRASTRRRHPPKNK